MKLTVADIARFHTLYTPVTECGCWLWERGVDKDGYGYFYIKSRTYHAHRASWTIHHGPIQAGLQVLHKCDNPLCVNPDHLFLGTSQDNMSDKVKKERQARGETIAWAKLTERDVFEIRSAAPFLSQRELARLYSVTSTLIHLIVKQSIWKHVAVEAA